MSLNPFKRSTASSPQLSVAQAPAPNTVASQLVESVTGVVVVGPESAHWLSIILDREVAVGEPFDLGEVAVNNPNVNLEHLFSKPLEEVALEVLASREG